MSNGLGNQTIWHQFSDAILKYMLTVVFFNPSAKKWKVGPPRKAINSGASQTEGLHEICAIIPNVESLWNTVTVNI